MGTQPRRGLESELIHRLDAECGRWLDHTGFGSVFRYGGAKDERLPFEDGHQLVAAAPTRDCVSWADRDQVLPGLLERATDDTPARRIALQVVLPGSKSLTNGTFPPSTESDNPLGLRLTTRTDPAS